MTCCGNCNEEPALGDLLDDPIVALLMARDGITRPEVERLMDEFALQPVHEKHVAACACRPSGNDLGSPTKLGLLDRPV